jgi:hypothetical protein
MSEKREKRASERRMSWAPTRPEEVVRLNVGGHVFASTRSTLTKSADSMLAVLFGGKFSENLDRDGCVFIDRDGTNFRYILNFLRDGEVQLPPEVHAIRDILVEAEYYMVTELVELCKQALAPPP